MREPSYCQYHSQSRENPFLDNLRPFYRKLLELKDGLDSSSATIRFLLTDPRYSNVERRTLYSWADCCLITGTML